MAKKHIKPEQKKDRRRRFRYALILCGLILSLIALSMALSRCAFRGRIDERPKSNPQTEHSKRVEKSENPELTGYGLEIPRIEDEEFLIVCEEGRYTLLYDTLYRQAAWAAYVLTREDVRIKDAERKNSFIICRQVRENGWPYARESDYTGTGYDRGHLVPSADRVGTQTENNATFRMSNIAPQSPRLNRVVWNNLEAEIRRMAERFDTLRIVTGGVLKPDIPLLGESRIGVPAHFFKVLLVRVGDEFHSIGFVIPNTPPIDGTYWDYSVTVDSVQRLTGIDFFPNLPDPLETRIETEYLPFMLLWTATK